MYGGGQSVTRLAAANVAAAVALPWDRCRPKVFKRLATRVPSRRPTFDNPTGEFGNPDDCVPRRKVGGRSVFLSVGPLGS